MDDAADDEEDDEEEEWERATDEEVYPAVAVAAAPSRSYIRGCNAPRLGPSTARVTLKRYWDAYCCGGAAELACVEDLAGARRRTAEASESISSIPARIDVLDASRRPESHATEDPGGDLALELRNRTCERPKRLPNTRA